MGRKNLATGIIIGGILLVSALLPYLASFAQPVPQSPGIKRVIFISIDSCNPEYLSPAYMPKLYERILRDGIKFKCAQSILASETQAGHTSLLTGSYPEHSGMIGNGLYFPGDVDSDGDGDIDYHAGDEIFTFIDPQLRLSKTIFEQFAGNASMQTAMVSGKWRLIPLLGSGAGLIFGNPKNGSIVFPDEYYDDVGAPFTYAEGDTADPWTMNALLQMLRVNPDTNFTFLNMAWLDDVQHNNGGFNLAVYNQLRELDNLFVQLFDYLESIGQYDSTLFVITADHGSETTKFVLNLFDLFNSTTTSPRINAHVFAEGQGAYIFLEDQNQLADALSMLQAQDGVGLVVPRNNSGLVGYDNYTQYHLYPYRNRTGDIYVAAKEGGATVIRPNIPLMLNGIHGGPSAQDVPMAFIGKNVPFKRSLKGREILDYVPNTVDLMPTLAHVMNWTMDKMTLDGVVLDIFQ